MQLIFKFYLLLHLLLVSAHIFADEENENAYRKLDKDGIQVYVFKTRDSDFATFKAVTVINASLDSILAVMLDNSAYTDWIQNCKQSLVIEQIDFYERYHYQVIDIPFPFDDRDIMMHSTLTQDRLDQSLTITTSAVTDFCHERASAQCKKIKQSALVRIHNSTGTHKLEPGENGVKITWVQHTDPAGELPSWLVNQLVVDIPYKTLKNLTRKVKEEKYHYAKIIYDHKGEVVALNMPTKKQRAPSSLAKELAPYATF